MELEFHRTSDALNYTMEFYKIGKIKDHMLILAGKDANSKYKLEWYDLIFNLHTKMEGEILQVIHTTNHNTQVFFFETLKSWLNSYKVQAVHVPTIINEIENYNKNTLEAFEIKVQNEVDKLHASEEYKTKKHLEEYETMSFGHSIGGMLALVSGAKKRTVKHYKYYCITEIPELLDTDYTPKYVELLATLLVNLRNVLSKYVKLYDEGKIKAHDVVYVNPQLPVLPQKEQKLLPSPKGSKINAKLTIPQLAYLFKMLNDEGIIDSNTYKEIHEMIANNFTVSSKDKGEDISASKIGKMWNAFEAKTAAFWIAKFIDLHNRAKKDNPNNIKLED